MKKLVSLALVLMLSLCLIAQGEIVGNTYDNPQFGILASFPDGWKLQTSLDEPSTELGATFELLSAEDASGIENFSINVIALGSLAAQFPDDVILDAVQENITSAYADINMSPTFERVTLNVMGSEYDTLLIVTDVYGMMTMVQRYVVVIKGEYAIEFTATGFSEESTLSMFDSITLY